MRLSFTLDAGTGSGCILLSLLAELPLAHGLGTDISRDALAIATENARRLGVAERTEFRQGRYLDATQGEFDVVVSNGEHPDLKRLKPAPDGMLLAAAELGVLPEHCLVIGDRDDADGAAARAAGMAFRLIR